MFKFVKILILFFLVLVLALTYGWMYYSGPLLEKGRVFITRMVAESLQKPVEMDSLEFIPPFSVNLKGLVIFKSVESDKKFMEFGKAVITPDIIAILKGRRLKVTVEIENAVIENTKINTFITVESNPADSYKNIFSPILIDSVTILTGEIISDNYPRIEKIIGFLDIKNLDIVKGKFSFRCKHKNYLTSFNKIENQAYNVQFRSERIDIDLEGDISKKDGDLIFENFKGYIQPFKIFFSGGIEKFFSEEEKKYKLNGTIETRLAYLLESETEWEYKHLLKKNSVDGVFKAVFKIESKDLDFDGIDASGNITLEDLTITNKQVLESLETDFIKKGKNLSLPNLHAKMFGGEMFSNIKIRLLPNNFPDVSSLKISTRDINIKKFIKTFNINAPIFSGIVNMNLNLNKIKNSVSFNYENPVTGVSKSVYSLCEWLIKYEGAMDIDALKFKIGNIKFNELTAKLFLSKGIISIPDIADNFYGGKLKGDFIVDIKDTILPFILNFNINDSNFGKLFSDIKNEKLDVDGKINGKLLLKGSLVKSSSIKGAGSINVDDADLGPMPLLTPLLGRIYSALENVFAPSHAVRMNALSADFDIKNERVITENLTILGNDIVIVGNGYIGFNSELDIYFETQFVEPQEGAETNLIKNTIAQFGQYISKARLKGTLQEPKWHFEYDFKNLITNQIKNLFGGLSQS
ncbi:membrane or secreted protein [Candidatus Omnitrophus magneticus]|uniref:Membrane or secreted protein n=1 Tax=Candidatus Omnitrophus magneticus TaxID=1609969 RepID=A0A0F0CQ85_9BACT|nr:membrane or secreted protein [Candidatus Omnitrophus magneticus]